MKKIFLLGLIVAIGFILRTWSIKWGLTTTKYFHFATYHPDESENIKAIASLNPQKLDFKIDHYLVTRGTFQIYLTAGWIKLVSLFNFVKLIPSFDYYKANPEELVKLYVTGRSMSVFFGVLTIPLLFIIANKFYDDYRISLLSSFLLAITPLHVVWSYYIGTDALLTFEICVIFLLCFYIMKNPSQKTYLLTGLLVGLTCATKYSSVPIVMIPIFAHILGGNKLLDKKLFFYFLFIPVGFSIGNPYSIIDFRGFVSAIIESIRINLVPKSGGPDCFETQPGWIYYSTTAPKYALGLPFAFLSLIAIIYAIIKREKFDVLILSFLALFLGLIGSSPWRLVRWFLPFVPFLCLLSARFVFSIKHLKSVIWILTVLILGYTFLYSYSYVKLMSEKDVRDEASEWIERNIQEGKKIAVQCMYFWNPSITMTLYWYKETEPFYKNIKRYKILQISDVEKLDIEKPDYVILSDYEYFPILKLRHKFPNEHLLPFLNKVMNSDEYILIKRFEKYPNICGIKTIGGFYPHDWRYTCPTILIYERKK